MKKKIKSSVDNSIVYTFNNIRLTPEWKEVGSTSTSFSNTYVIHEKECIPEPNSTDMQKKKKLKMQALAYARKKKAQKSMQPKTKFSRFSYNDNMAAPEKLNDNIAAPEKPEAKSNRAKIRPSKVKSNLYSSALHIKEIIKVANELNVTLNNDQIDFICRITAKTGEENLKDIINKIKLGIPIRNLYMYYEDRATNPKDKVTSS